MGAWRAASAADSAYCDVDRWGGGAGDYAALEDQHSRGRCGWRCNGDGVALWRAGAASALWRGADWLVAGGVGQAYLAASGGRGCGFHRDYRVSLWSELAMTSAAGTASLLLPLSLVFLLVFLAKWPLASFIGMLCAL